MPHVDEGILHAYLDGALDALHDDGALPDAMTPADVIAHLDACADCRARLTIERDIREQAGEVLRHAAPIIHTPPLESLRTTRRPAPWVPYAWAASVVMAVGAGWLGSQLARDLPQAVTEPAASVAEDMSLPPQTTPPPPTPASLADAEVVAPSAPTGGEAQANVQSAGFGAEAQKTVASVPPPTVGAESRGAAAVDAIQARVGTVQAQQQSPRQQAVDTSVANQQQSNLMARRAAPAAPPPPPPPAPMTPLSRFLTALNLMRSQGFAWRPVTAGDSVVAFGIGGATNTRIEIAVAPDIGDVVRVRQRLTDGRDIDLVHWRQPSDVRVFREEAAAADAGNAVVSGRQLDDGTEQVIVQANALRTLVAIIVVGTDGVALAQRLTIIR